MESYLLEELDLLEEEKSAIFQIAEGAGRGLTGEDLDHLDRIDREIDEVLNELEVLDKVVKGEVSEQDTISITESQSKGD